MSQQFCLKWNNHMNNMMDVFKNLLSTESMVDVTLACDGLSLKAHKMVLSACSPFFQSLFLENPCKHPIVILKDMKYTELKAIIEFMYHGEVNVAQDQLSALMKTAETLRVKGLAEVTNEKNSQSNNSSQDEPGHRSVPRTDTPPPPNKRRRGRTRKRSLSDSNRSDDDSSEPKIKQPMSPEIEELSGDVTMDASTSQFSNLQSQVPLQSTPSHSSNTFHKTSSVISQDPQIEEPASADESEFGVEPAKLLEQTLTTDELNARRGRSSNVEMQRRPRSSATDHSTIVPTSMSSDTSNQQPDSPLDIKPELLELDPPMSPVAGPSHSNDNAMMMYMDQSSVSSHPGTSYQDSTALVSQDSQPQVLGIPDVYDWNFFDPSNSNAQIRLTQNKRGKARLQVDHYDYRVRSHHGTKIYWECEMKLKLNCQAQLHSRGYEIVKKSEHSHDPISAVYSLAEQYRKKGKKPKRPRKLLKKISSTKASIKERYQSLNYYKKKKKEIRKTAKSNIIIGKKKSGKTTEVLEIDGYFYKKDRVAGDKIYYRCHLKAKLKCKARVIVHGKKIKAMNGEHNHDVDHKYSKKVLALEEAASSIKEEVAETSKEVITPSDA